MDTVAPTYQIPGLVLTEHTIDVPLDHARPDGAQISIFARVVADPDGLDRPFLLFLQGGPGFEGPRPTRFPTDPSWLDRALRDFRVVLLDQRGTGRSTPVGNLDGLTAREQADYLAHFRADAIVYDAEALRQHLGARTWSVLGQSFGGFTALSYLSMAPAGLREVLFTGGVPPVGGSIDAVYRATYARVIERSRRFYNRYPRDRDRILDHHRAIETGVTLPSGDQLSKERLRQLGHLLGAKAGAEHLHYILELDPSAPAFGHAVEQSISWARNPLYAAIHEACYGDGEATRWAAARALPSPYDEDPTLFTGEHVYPWMFTQIAALAPLRDAADLLADRPWPQLYDPAQLAVNEVPAAAAIYAEDMYVDARFSQQTATMVRGLRPWVTDEHEHDALRIDGAMILDRLISLVRGDG
jgi:pimeloyl-ACP methyl ester carboxylesterase